MNEPTMQVPVSLIERVASELEVDSRIRSATDLRALLAQPTPTAGHADDCCYLEEDVVEPHGSRISPNAHCTCGPPLIEGLTPGTTFQVGDESYKISPSGRILYAGWRLTPWSQQDHQFDPSTIRDVQPPKDAA